MAGSLQLTWSRAEEEARLVVVRHIDLGRAPMTVSFRPVPPRVAILMVFPPTDRTIDISGQPAVLPMALSEADDAAQTIAAVGEWVTALALTLGAWAPSTVVRTEALIALLGSVAFPMLSSAYRMGPAPAVSIPTWAAPVLRQATARIAASAAFGPRATRPVVAAFAASLATGDQVSLLPLGLGIAGAGVLEPDQLARLLRVRTISTDPPPTTEQIRDVRSMAAWLGARRAEKVLIDGAVQPDRLWETAAMFAQVAGRIRGNPAGRLDDLYAQCFSYMAHPPRPRATRAGLDLSTRRAPARQGSSPGQQDDRFRRAALNAPTAEAAVSASTILRIPADIRSQDRVPVAGMRIVLPRTVGDLRTWGSLLSNCIGTYGPAAASGMSFLFGVEESDRLAYCLELSRNRIVRQFVGRRNRPVPPVSAAQIIGHLTRNGVVDGRQPANRRWLRTGAG